MSYRPAKQKTPEANLRGLFEDQLRKARASQNSGGYQDKMFSKRTDHTRTPFGAARSMELSKLDNLFTVFS